MNFERFAELHGLIINHLTYDRWVRVPTVDKPHSKNGAYIFDGKTGAVQNWAIHDKPVSFRSKTYTPDPDWKAKRAKAEQDRAKRNNEAIKRAKYILDNSKKSSHPYLIKKGFTEGKQWVWNDLLVIPMRIDQKLVGCQLISQDGTKKFLSGQITKGAETIIDAKGRHILCEGYATALSLRRAIKTTGKRYTIHVCFSAGNILEMATKYPTSIICADNDDTGTRTAIATGKPYWISPHAGEDFNDFELRVGSEVAGKAFIEAFV